MNERWVNFLARDDGHRVGVIRFQSVMNPDLNRAWIGASRHWIEDVGGERVYAGNLDVVQGRAALCFDQLLLEEYPSRQAAFSVMERTGSYEEAGLRDQFVIGARPESRFSHKLSALVGRIVKRLGPIEVVEVPEVGYHPDTALVGLNPDEAQIAVFHRGEQWSPCFMINMNEFSRRSKPLSTSETFSSLRRSGRDEYSRYVRHIVLEVYRRGGNFLWISTPITVLEGDSNHPLARNLSQFAVLCWPSRMALRHMLASPKFQQGVPHRNAGLANAIAIPGTPWPDFSRYAL